MKCFERDKRPVCNEECSRIKKEKEEVHLALLHSLNILSCYQFSYECYVLNYLTSLYANYACTLFQEKARKLAEAMAEEERIKEAEREALLRRIQGQPKKRKSRKTKETATTKSSLLMKHKFKIIIATALIIAIGAVVIAVLSNLA